MTLLNSIMAFARKNANSCDICTRIVLHVEDYQIFDWQDLPQSLIDHYMRTNSERKDIDRNYWAHQAAE